MGELRYAEFYSPNTPYLPLDNHQEQNDYVQTYWENELLQFALRPFLRKLVRQRQREEQKIRILDIGAGYGHGYQLLTHIKNDMPNLAHEPSYILSEEMTQLYMGLDLDYHLVEQANYRFRDERKIRFIRFDYFG
ncbi:MAG: hypothetical protein HC880_15745, partial [Bacteroidia bacterium]|nr:hypothetical protein [Bacteroidia bacterium]